MLIYKFKHRFVCCNSRLISMKLSSGCENIRATFTWRPGFYRVTRNILVWEESSFACTIFNEMLASFSFARPPSWVEICSRWCFVRLCAHIIV